MADQPARSFPALSVDQQNINLRSFALISPEACSFGPLAKTVITLDYVGPFSVDCLKKEKKLSLFNEFRINFTCDHKICHAWPSGVGHLGLHLIWIRRLQCIIYLASFTLISIYLHTAWNWQRHFSSKLVQWRTENLHCTRNVASCKGQTLKWNTWLKRRIFCCLALP